MDIKIKQKKFHEITYLEIDSEQRRSKKRMIIIFHGHRSHKEVLLNQAYSLACEGFLVILPDAYMHGERNPEEKEFDLFEVVTKTTDEIDDLINRYPLYTKVGIAGYSMGGFIVYNYLAKKEKKIDAAVSLISTPKWTTIKDADIAKKYFDEHGIKPGSSELEKLIRNVANIQPLTHFMNMVDIPLLMMNGNKDKLTAVGGATELYELLLPRYKDKNAIELIVYDEIEHQNTPQMDKKMIEWFVKYL